MERCTLPELTDAASALLIGNELLSGKVREANLHELSRTLRAVGIRLQRVVMVEDDVDVIANEVRAMSSQFDVVFTSGGVGPTHDDVTVAAVARAFGVPTRIEPTLAALLREHYGDRCCEAHLRMALVPVGARMAAAADVPWPTVVMHNVWMLPGVPEVFRMKLAVIRLALRGSAPFFCRAAFVRLDEAELKPLLDRIVAAHPEVQVGSYPKWRDPTYRTQITFDARSQAATEAAVATFVAGLCPDDLVRID